MFEHLNKTRLFNGLKQNEIESLFKNKEYFKKKFYPKNYIAYRGDEIEHLLIILKGEVQTLISNEKGKIRNVILLSRYCAIAPSFLFGKNNKFPVDVKAVKETTILYIKKDSLLNIVKENHIVLENYINILSDKAQILSRELWKGFKNNTIRKKILDYIIERVDTETMIVEFDMSLEDLAKYFDVSRPSLSRALNEFIKNGELQRLKRGKYQIKNTRILGVFNDI